MIAAVRTAPTTHWELHRFPRLPDCVRAILALSWSRLLPRTRPFFRGSHLLCDTRLGGSLRFGPLAARQPSAGARALRYIETKDIRQIAAQNLGRGGSLFGQRNRLASFDDEFLLVHCTQPEQEFRLVVQPGADAIEYCRHMFAHVRPIRATA